MLAFGVLYYIPIYIQVLDYSTTQAGLRLLPNSVGQALRALAAGFIIRATGSYYRLNIATHVFTVLGSGLLIHLSLSSPSWFPFLILAIVGLGFGGMLVINLTAVISSVLREEQALATSASFVFRSAGSSWGLHLHLLCFKICCAIRCESSLAIWRMKRTSLQNSQ
ncbi:hypothetical protein VTL71DRAFT_3986 [Oculimacula yallundae]|uniref:Uncharacterized protein n=1 Tax=Oculimacula yallundae TaxID=86028 RepID=A0ABR4C678_9HELO